MSSSRSSLPSYTRAARSNQQAKRYPGPDLAPASASPYAASNAAAAAAAPRGRRGVSATVTPTQSFLGAGKSHLTPRHQPPFPPNCLRCEAQRRLSAAVEMVRSVGWFRHQLANRPERQAAAKTERRTDRESDPPTGRSGVFCLPSRP